MSRANNDFYEVNAGACRYALRVAKADFRSSEEYAFEANYVHHLYENGCAVPAPIPAKGGELFFEVDAPEGVRAVTLMHWLNGENLNETLTVDDAKNSGAALASLHQAGDSFETDHSRDIDTIEILNERMPDLLAMLDHDAEQKDFYATATEKVKKALKGIAGRSVRRGAVHGDFQFANILKTEDGSIAVLDFDTCGIGYLAEDLFTFVWRSDMEIKKDSINEAFLAGYESVNPLNADEKEHCAVFRVARDLVMSSTFAILINRVGPVPGFDGDFAPFTSLAKTHLADAGL